MRRGSLAGAVLAALLVGMRIAVAADINAQRGVIDFLAPVDPDPIVQHSKEVYVGYGCAYCHGVDLRVRNGEAADLYASALVGFDHDGDLIGPLVRTGVAATEKLSPMPQFSDISEQEMTSIVRWVHHARQQRKYVELKAAALKHGDAAAGKDYFAANCTECHATGSDFPALRKAKDERALADGILRPAFVDQQRRTMALSAPVDARKEAARARHLSLLERYGAADIDDLVAYIRDWR